MNGPCYTQNSVVRNSVIKRSRCTRVSGAANSEVQGQTWQNFEHIWDILIVFVASENEEDLIKNEAARVAKTTCSIYT